MSDLTCEWGLDEPENDCGAPGKYSAIVRCRDCGLLFAPMITCAVCVLSLRSLPPVCENCRGKCDVEQIASLTEPRPVAA